jgi:hypothetical protein
MSLISPERGFRRTDQSVSKNDLDYLKSTSHTSRPQKKRTARKLFACGLPGGLFGFD